MHEVEAIRRFANRLEPIEPPDVEQPGLFNTHQLGNENSLEDTAGIGHNGGSERMVSGISHESYLDNNATTQPLPQVRDAMFEVLAARFGNPSSAHAAGDRALSISTMPIRQSLL